MDLGRRIAAALPQGGVISIEGPLGAGKTVLVKGVAIGLGIADEVTSPTFTLITSYEGPVPLHHVDLYRLANPAETDDLGLEELMGPGRVVVLEWGEKARDLLPPETVQVSIRPTADHRLIEVRGLAL